MAETDNFQKETPVRKSSLATPKSGERKKSVTMVFENNTTIEYNADTPDGDDGDGEEEDDIATESSSNDETLVLIYYI